MSIAKYEEITRDSAISSEVKLGSLLNTVAGVFTYAVTTGAADITAVYVPYACEIVDVVVQPRGASTNGTMKITDGTSDITDAITCAVDKTIGRAGTIDDAKSTLAAGSEIHIVCAGDTVANTKGLVTITVIPAL